MGKGDSRRPPAIPLDEFNKRWDDIFGKRRVKDSTDPDQQSLLDPKSQPRKRQRRQA